MPFFVRVCVPSRHFSSSDLFELNDSSQDGIDHLLNRCVASLLKCFALLLAIHFLLKGTNKNLAEQREEGQLPMRLFEEEIGTVFLQRIYQN